MAKFLSMWVVWDGGDYQIPSCNRDSTTASPRSPRYAAAPSSTAGVARVNGAVLPSCGPVSPATKLPPARAFPSGSVTLGPTGPSATSWRSPTAFTAKVSRLSAAFSLRSCFIPHRGQVQCSSLPQTLVASAAVRAELAGWKEPIRFHDDSPVPGRLVADLRQ